MAHLDNQIRTTIKNYVEREFKRLLIDNILIFEDSFSSKNAEVSKKIEYIQKSINNLLNNTFENLNRQQFVEKLKEFEASLRFTRDEFADILVNYSRDLNMTLVALSEINSEFEPDIEEIYSMITAIENFEAKIGGQTIIYSIRTVKNLRQVVENHFYELELKKYRDINEQKIKNEMQKVTLKEKEYQKKLENTKNDAIDLLSPLITDIIQQISNLNITNNEFFRNFTNLVGDFLGIYVEIEEYVPDEDYNDKYARFLFHCEEGGGAIKSLAKELYPSEDFESYENWEVCNYLRDNYFS